MRPNSSLTRIPRALTLTMVRVKEQGWNICSHVALHNWSQLVNAALRPVTMTMLEAIEAPTLGRWRGALHATRPDASDVIRLAEDGEMMTAVLNAHRHPVGAAPEAARSTSPAPLANDCGGAAQRGHVARLRHHGGESADAAPASGDAAPDPSGEATAEIPGLSKMLKPDLITRCRTRGIESHGLTCDRMRLALQNWTPPTLVGAPTVAAGATSSMAASSTTMPVPKLNAAAVPLQPVPKTKSRAPMPVPTPMTPTMTRRSSSATPSPAARTSQPLATPGGTPLMCPIHQCQLIMKQNRADRSLFWSCAMCPNCKVTMTLEAYTVMDELMTGGQAQQAAFEEAPAADASSTAAPATQPMGDAMMAQAAELEAQRERLQQMELQMIAQQHEVNAARDRVLADHQQAMAEVAQAACSLRPTRPCSCHRRRRRPLRRLRWHRCLPRR